MKNSPKDRGDIGKGSVNRPHIPHFINGIIEKIRDTGRRMMVTITKESHDDSLTLEELRSYPYREIAKKVFNTWQVEEERADYNIDRSLPSPSKEYEAIAKKVFLRWEEEEKKERDIRGDENKGKT